MARYYKLFKTKKEQKDWEDARKSTVASFRLCMRMSAKELAADLHRDPTTFSEYKYATIWTTDF